MRTEDVKELRRLVKLTQQEFAMMFEVIRSTVTRWESGKVKSDKLARKKLE
jgi:DNA-binding transcriptional regulator YiaG|tara:strand:- start:335 stop:487 length:153 start_codon:yes stop_codon:yes gene_type:complete